MDNKNRKKFTIGVNFTGTLVDENEFGYVVPISGAKEAMTRLKTLGCRLIIYSRMVCTEDQKGQESKKMTEALDEFLIPYDDVYVGDRLVADFYIDDRAIPFKGNWDETREEVEIAIFSAAKQDT